MRRMIRDIYRKVHYGAIIPWDCILLGHLLKPHPSGSPRPSTLSWWYCCRPGCRHEEGMSLANDR